MSTCAISDEAFYLHLDFFLLNKNGKIPYDHVNPSKLKYTKMTKIIFLHQKSLGYLLVILKSFGKGQFFENP